MGSVVEGVVKYFSQCYQLPLKLVTEEKDFFYDGSLILYVNFCSLLILQGLFIKY